MRMTELAAKLATVLESVLIDPNYVENNEKYIAHPLKAAKPVINEHLDRPTMSYNERPCPDID